jgi:hypothetical protein
MATFGEQRRKKQIGWASGIFILALLAFNFPILGIFRHPKLIGGIPSLLWYVLAVWMLTIIATFFMVRSKADRS